MKKILCIFVSVLLALACLLPAIQAEAKEEAAQAASSTRYTYTEQDLYLIARVVYAEARNQPYLGRVAVALVVFNRYESGKYGKTLAQVTRKGQFAKAKRTNSACLKAVVWALKNRVLPSNTYYFQRSKRMTWGGRPSIKRYCRIGAHSFYTLGNPKPVPGKRYIDRNGKLITR